MHVLKFFFFVMVLPGLFACAQKQPRALVEPTVNDALAVVYLYRPASMSNIVISPVVVVDNKDSFELANDSYTYLLLEPGSHRLRLDLSERYQGRHQQVFNVEGGQRYYFRVDTRMKFQQNALYQRSFDLRSVEAAQAVKQITACNYFPRPGHREQTPSRFVREASDTADDAHFSISRSRDPFGRNK